MSSQVKVLILSIMTVLVFSSFSSPEKDGRYTAQLVNKCHSTCIDDLRKLEQNCIESFNNKNFKTRKAAKQAYFSARKKVFEQHDKNLNSVKEYLHRMEVKYEKESKAWARFKQSYNETLDTHLQQRVSALKKDKRIPATVLAKIRAIVPAKPSLSQMQRDLNGKSIAEGVSEEDERWFSDEWRLKIKSSQIRDLKMLKILKNTESEYKVLVSMKIVTDINSFDVKAVLNYILPESDDWKLEFVMSKGVRLVQTHRYDDCISCSLKSDGWGGVDALYIRNSMDFELAVGGAIYSNGQWKKFAVLVAPNDTKMVGGTFGGGSVTSYRIDMVERLH